MKITVFWVALVVGGVGFGSVSQGQSKTHDTLKKHYQRIQKIDLDGQTIRGGKGGPGGLHFVIRLGTKHAKLFKVRQHWKKKLSGSVSQL